MSVIPMGQRCCLGKSVHYNLLRSKGGVYGAEVLCRGERASFPGLSPDRRRVCALLRRMLRGRVMPAAAADVVEDWLAADAG